MAKKQTLEEERQAREEVMAEAMGRLSAASAALVALEGEAHLLGEVHDRANAEALGTLLRGKNPLAPALQETLIPYLTGPKSYRAYNRALSEVSPALVNLRRHTDYPLTGAIPLLVPGVRFTSGASGAPGGKDLEDRLAAAQGKKKRPLTLEEKALLAGFSLKDLTRALEKFHREVRALYPTLSYGIPFSDEYSDLADWSFSYMVQWLPQENLWAVDRVRGKASLLGKYSTFAEAAAVAFEALLP